MRKRLKFERDNEETKEEIYNVLGHRKALIGKIFKGKYGWTLELDGGTWWTKDCLYQCAEFLGYLSLRHAVEGKPQ